MIRLVSWNVNGIRANIKKGFWENIDILKPDLLGIQETKSDKDIMLSGVVDSPVFDIVFHSCSMKKGYSGVATFHLKNKAQESVFENINISHRTPSIELYSSAIGIEDEKFDAEGRLVTTKYKILNPKTNINQITLINGYYPQGGRDGRVPYKIEFYQKVYQYARSLREQGENIILCGDLNTTVGDIDLARPKENRKTTGCLPEEREALNWFLENGFVDSFRHFYPEKVAAYSYWDQITRARDRNVGWRIDYFLVDSKLIPYLKDAYIWPEIMGSDHCPVGIDLDL